jgi:MYXO-CTERM domain-containing protein
VNVKTLGMVAVAATLASSVQASIVVASDNASNYGGSWTTGSNGGTGFGAWDITTGGDGSKGAYIGDPALKGISGMSSSSFGLYANGGGGASITASRSFGAALGVGDSFSFQWGINWDSDFFGNKGFNLFVGSTEVINVNNGGNSDITLNGTNVGFGYGTNAMTWTFTQTTATSVTVTANDRDGSGTYSGVINVTGALSGFSMYATTLAGVLEGNREPFFNNFAIDAVPAPGALALLGVAGIVGARRRR